jgi:hypothetical protein
VLLFFGKLGLLDGVISNRYLALCDALYVYFLLFVLDVLFFNYFQSYLQEAVLLRKLEAVRAEVEEHPEDTSSISMHSPKNERRTFVLFEKELDLSLLSFELNNRKGLGDSFNKIEVLLVQGERRFLHLRLVH